MKTPKLYHYTFEKGDQTMFLRVSALALCLVMATGCDGLHEGATLPRVSDATFIKWLDGEMIDMGSSWFSPAWRIRSSEVSGFKVTKITENPIDETLTATVKFRVTEGGKGVDVPEAMIRYVPVEVDEKSKLQYVEFVVVRYERIGQ